MMRKIITFVVLMAIGMSALAETETGTKDDPIRSVPMLLKRIVTANETYHGQSRATTLYIAPGNYDVSVTNMLSYDEAGVITANADCHLAVAGYVLRGTTTNPRDVVIYGDRSSRIFILSKAGLQYLTVSNGCCTAVGDGKRGGGVYAKGGGGNNRCKSTYVVVTDCESKSFGGGVCGGNWSYCTFMNNKASNGYGGASATSGTYEECFFTNNMASGIAGAAYYEQTLKNCRIVGNKAGAGGGGIATLSSGEHQVYMIGGELAYNEALGTGDGFADGLGGGAYCCFLSGGVKVHHNKAAKFGGGLYIKDSGFVVTNVVFYSNEASYGGGGVCLTNRASIVDCVVSNNVVDASGLKYARACGGGVYMLGPTDGTYSSISPWVKDSHICFNRVKNDKSASGSCAYGGGVFGGSATNCFVYGNAVISGATNVQGGGGYGTWMYECEIFNNANIDNGLGVALNRGAAWHCVFSNNVGQAAAPYVIRQTNSNPVDGCIIRDGGVTGVRMINCRLDSTSNAVYLAEGANCAASGWFTYSDPYMLAGVSTATNCLFANCYTPNQALVNRNGSGNISLYNCTIADNTYNYLYRTVDEKRKIIFENCLIIGNDNGSGSARNLYTSDEFSQYGMFANNVVGSAGYQLKNPASEENTYKIDNARFVGGDGPDRYALRSGSPARGKGVVRDWMTGAFDIRNNPDYPRLREGKVDAGCYQCWLDPVGAYFIVR